MTVPLIPEVTQLIVPSYRYNKPKRATFDGRTSLGYIRVRMEDGDMRTYRPDQVQPYIEGR